MKMNSPTTCINTNSTVRTLFILSLLGFFFWKFAIPAMTKYRNSGYMFDQHTRDRLKTDSPAITFCRMDNFSAIGWKNISRKFRGFDWKTTWAEWFCKGSRRVEDIIECMEELTFNHEETIENSLDASSFWNFNETANHDWISTMTSLYLGKFHG